MITCSKGRSLVLRRGISSSIGIRFTSSWLSDAERWKASFVAADKCDEAPTPIEVVRKADYPEWVSAQPSTTQRWLTSIGKGGGAAGIPKPHSHFFLPSSSDGGSDDDDAASLRVVFVANDDVSPDGDDGGLSSPFAFSSLPASLPPGRYCFSPACSLLPDHDSSSSSSSSSAAVAKSFQESAALGWALGAYEFNRYKTTNKPTSSSSSSSSSSNGSSRGGGGEGGGGERAQLVFASSSEEVSPTVSAAATATYLVRDLINTPAEDCGPAVLQVSSQDVAEEIVAEANQRMMSVAGGSGGGFATVRTVVGDALVDEGWPMVHAVGRAAAQGREPRMIDINWTPPSPSVPPTHTSPSSSSSSSSSPSPSSSSSVTLIGKGVTFDTGGLNLKPGNSMLTMKKDMGGAAQVLGLALMLTRHLVNQQEQQQGRQHHLASSTSPPTSITSTTTPPTTTTATIAHLRVLIPVAENCVSAESFRPGDVLMGRHGLVSTEVGNTDAEGRLILADALIEAASDAVVNGANNAADTAAAVEPSSSSASSASLSWRHVIVDCATLTGAARVATGTDIGCVFSNEFDVVGSTISAGNNNNNNNNNNLASSVSRTLQDLSFSPHLRDPMWAQPLTKLYAQEISSDIADVRNIGAGGPGGHITAALYLETFVKAGAEHGAASLSHLSTASAKKEKTEATGAATATGAGNTAAAGATASGSETGGCGDGGGRGGVGDGVISWVHLDFMGFNKRARHGRPKGGEAQGMRTLFDYLTSPSLRQ